MKKTLKDEHLHRPLLYEVRITEEVNSLVHKGLLHDHELKNCELFYSECKMTQCYKCCQYSHIVLTCRQPQTCGNYAKKHPFTSCPTSNDPRTFTCKNRKGKHRAWDKSCLVKKTEAEQAATASATRPTLQDYWQGYTYISAPPPDPTLPTHHSAPN
jgi:hypothetical protein